MGTLVDEPTGFAVDTLIIFMLVNYASIESIYLLCLKESAILLNTVVWNQVI